VTGKPNILRPSRREVKIDVWKYLQHIVMGLNAVLGRHVRIRDRGHHPQAPYKTHPQPQNGVPPLIDVAFITLRNNLVVLLETLYT